MFVLWWTGRGYQTLLIWLLVMIGFGIIQAIGRSIIPDSPWYWGLGFAATAALNWRRGTDLNSKSRGKRKGAPIMQQLFYKGGHRFMSMPMETFSLVLVLAGLAVALSPFFSSGR